MHSDIFKLVKKYVLYSSYFPNPMKYIEWQRIWVFVTNINLLILISLQPNSVILWYFKLKTFWFNRNLNLKYQSSAILCHRLGNIILNGSLKHMWHFLRIQGLLRVVKRRFYVFKTSYHSLIRTTESGN